MGTPLRALIVEDSEQDCELLLRGLRQGGFDVTWRRVETADAMRDALTNEEWDFIFSDFAMPEFSGFGALLMVFDMNVDLPFFIVSGTIGEETAVEAMRGGAHDYFIKGRLARLCPAVERALRDAADRREKKKLKEDLLFADRMATVGTLAAGVAHEINNPLSAVIANVDCVLEALREFEVKSRETPSLPDNVGPCHDWNLVIDPLVDVRDAGMRIREIVRDLKLFSRHDQESHGAVDVTHVLDSASRMAWIEIRQRARLVKDYGEAPLVAGSDGRLGQVFLNLILNAARAISEGAADKNEIRLVTGTVDGRAFVEVRDTGVGIPADVVSKIWDPFFTTKPIGQGTGLGLSISRSIVSGLGGEITVKSAVGRGTTFRVTLPVATKAPESAATPFLVAPPKRRARVLIVDDEENVTRAIARMIGKDHDVTIETSGADALRRLKANEAFDVVLCDLMMPHMSGMALYDELVAANPVLAGRFIFMSGGAFTPAARAFLGRVTNPRIEKPFDFPNLLHLIASMVK